MQINNLVPILLELLSLQTGQNNRENRPAPRRQAGETVLKQAGDAALKQTGKATPGEAAEAALKEAAKPSPAQGAPDFLPLPLKSPLFNESSFFVRRREEPVGEGKEESGRGHVFVRLRTENLGVVWISLDGGNSSLKISFYTESDTFTHLFRDSFTALSEGLRDLGYPSVNLAGITRPGIRDCSEIAPGGSSPGSYLLDLEV